MSNSLAEVHPELVSEWSEKNLPLTPDDITFGSNKKVWWKAWWKCKTCGYEWNTLISTRSGDSKCPCCSGYTFIKGRNDLKSTHPQIAKEWSEKNYPLQPDEVNAKSRKNVWWHCRKCGNEWKSVINARVKGTVCPVCAEREVLAGYNDLATTDKQLLIEWNYELNKLKPTEVSRNSAKESMVAMQIRSFLKSNFLSEKYGLEDKVIKFYPQQIAYLKSRVEGLTKDVETAKLHPKPIDEQPLGMMVSGVSYSEKAEAGQVIINACKSMNSPDAIALGEYRGFQMELYFDTVQRNYVVKLKGETSRDVPLGDDAHGNIVRIDNGIERFEEVLADTKNSLENTEKQFETAKQEIEKPFAKEEELRAKTARLDELNILLNMDKKENEIVGGEPDEGEAVGGRKEKSYER